MERSLYCTEIWRVTRAPELDQAPEPDRAAEPNRAAHAGSKCRSGQLLESQAWVNLQGLVCLWRSLNRSVRRESGSAGTPKAQVSARKRSGTRTADLGRCPRELWREVDSRPPTEGVRRFKRLISQVTGQRGGG
jgi:hypothetical protein